MCLETLCFVEFDHKKPIERMSGEEVLAEYLYLSSGHADEKERRGTKLGLSEELRVRRQALKTHIEDSIDLWDQK